jgi:hypothetical protein
MKQKRIIKKKQRQFNYYCLFIVVIDRKALSHCCLSYISRACNNIDVFRLLLLSIDDDEEQRNTFRAKSKENIYFFCLFLINLSKPGFDPANVREKLPDDNSGILTPSSISSTSKDRTGIG